MTDHRPDLAMPPRRVRQRMREGQPARGLTGRLPPRPLGLRAGAGLGLPAAPRPLGVRRGRELVVETTETVRTQLDDLDRVARAAVRAQLAEDAVHEVKRG
jgi:hypothetical protein